MKFSKGSLTNSGFSWTAALSLASASKLCYSKGSIVNEVVTTDWEFSSADVLDDGNTQAFIAVGDAALFVAFRGTDSLGDWLANMDIHSTERPFGSIHRGFYEAYTGIGDEVQSQIHAASIQGKTIWLTGHSLGGALAIVAALEVPEDIELGGILTFGQPRVVDRNTQEIIRRRFAEKYFRFVNDEDIVTKLPPNFHHAGKRIHFDYTGNVSRSMEEGIEAFDEERVLSQEEFASLQNEIATIRSGTFSDADMGLEGMIDDRALEGVFGASIAGLIPGVSDHSIDRYIAAIRRQNDTDEIDERDKFESLLNVFLQVHDNADFESGSKNNDRLKLENPGLEGLDFDNPALEGLDPFEDTSVASPAEEKRFPFMIRLRRPQWEAPEGLKIGSRIASFVTLQATEAELLSLKSDPNILSIEASRDAGIEELDSSISFVDGDVVKRPPIEETGNSAIVGIIDTGIDILHGAFLDDQGKTRILAIWNQRNSKGPTPKDIDRDAFTQDYGTVYTGTDIQSMIDDFKDNQKRPPAALRDPNRHGTHVSSIAAGRSVGNLGAGMAPEAHLMVVIPNMSTTKGDPPSLGYSNSHIDSLVFLTSAASGGNKFLDETLPIAINVSLGMNAGAHDGKSALEAAFDSITGSGRDPGRVIVKSAGNERGHGGHARRDVFIGLVKVTWKSTERFRRVDYLEAWFDALDDIEFAIVDPAGNKSSIVSFAHPVIAENLGGNDCELRLTKGHHDNGDNRLVITVRRAASAIQPGTWEIEIIGTQIRSDLGQVNFWFERTRSRSTRFDVEQQDMTLSIPGTANTVITVGACNTDKPLSLTSSSSYGRTRDGRPKPDICAPGLNITAALANTSDFTAQVTMTGTSMAAPHVTGALALVLSHRHKQTGTRQYNANQLQAALVRSVKNFSHRHHPGFGYGVLNVQNLFDEIP